MSGYKVSIITCTNRMGGIDVLLHSLKRQEFQDFQCLLLDEKYDSRHQEVIDYLEKEWPGTYGSKFLHVKPLPKKEGMFWNLDQSSNQGIALSSGEIIVFAQDYLWFPPDAIKKFVDRTEEMGDCLVTGVGHKALKPDFAIQLEGKITVFEDIVPRDVAEPEWGWKKPEGVWFRDPRIVGEPFRPGQPVEWEANYGSITRKILEEIGGIDEIFDLGWGYDNVNTAERAQHLGYEIWIDETNEHVGIAHELLFGESDFKAHAPNNVNVWTERLNLVQAGKMIRVPCLDEMREKLKLGSYQCI
jgi:hypothetical protein